MKIADVENAIKYIKQTRKTSHVDEKIRLLQHDLTEFCYRLNYAKRLNDGLIIGKYIYEKFPEDWSCLLAYVDILIECNEYNTAFVIINTIKFRERNDAWGAYCYLLKKNHQLDEAIKEGEKLVKKHPEDLKSLYLYAICLQDNKNHSEAQIIFKKIIKMEPNFWKAHSGLGFSLREGDSDYKESIEAFKKALEVAPKNNPKKPDKQDYAKIYHQLGLSYSLIPDLKNAEANYNTALSHIEDYAPALSGLEKLDNHTKHEKYNRARKKDEKRFERNHPLPSNAQSLVSLIPGALGNNPTKSIPTKYTHEIIVNKPTIEKNKKIINASAYQAKLSEVTKIKDLQSNKFGVKFDNWFQKTFISLPNGENGLLVQAQALAGGHNYVPAFNKLEIILSTIANEVKSQNFLKQPNINAAVSPKKNAQTKNNARMKRMKFYYLKLMKMKSLKQHFFLNPRIKVNPRITLNQRKSSPKIIELNIL